MEDGKRASRMKQMNHFNVNQHSFILTAILVLCIVAIVLFRDGVKALDFVALIAVASTFCFSWLLFRPGPSTFAVVDSVEKALESGKPTLLEFQSNY